MDAIIYVGKAIGTQIGVAIKLTYGWIPLFSCGLSLNLINMAYIFLVVREDKIIISEDNPSVDKGGAKQILTGDKSRLIDKLILFYCFRHIPKDFQSLERD